ncbi:MAG: helix-turn-helix domain-containing protein [Streptococcaceae bacterium]|jgi:hypothetical protein|nr:helix-turn-helix domain-containing protein [Streptococcaceae bacterium]
MKKELYLEVNEAYLIDLIKLFKKHPEGLLDAEICEKLKISHYRLIILRILFEKKREELNFQKKLVWIKNQMKSKLNFLKYQHEQEVADFLQAILQSSKIFKFASLLLQFKNISIHNISSRMKINEKKLRRISLQLKNEFRCFSLKVSEKGFRLDGDEGVIRELLLQFWWQTKSQNYWPVYFIKKERIKKMVDKIISRLGAETIAKSTCEELYLRVGIQLLRISRNYRYVKPLDSNLYLKTSKHYHKFYQCIKEQGLLSNLYMEEIDYLYNIFIYLGVIPLTALNVENIKVKSCFNAVLTFIDGLTIDIPSEQTKDLLNRLNFYLPIAKKVVLSGVFQQALSFDSENFEKCLSLAKEIIKTLEIYCLDVHQLACYYFYLLKLPIGPERAAKIYFANEENEIYKVDTKKQIEQVFQNFHSFQFVDESEKYQADIVLLHHHKTGEFYDNAQKQLFINKKLDAYDFGRINKLLIEVSFTKEKTANNNII